MIRFRDYLKEGTLPSGHISAVRYKGETYVDQRGHYGAMEKIFHRHHIADEDQDKEAEHMEFGHYHPRKGTWLEEPVSVHKWFGA